MDFIAEITAKMQLMTEEQKQSFIKLVYKYLLEEQKGTNKEAKSKIKRGV